jgi:hypothetical protein
MRIAIVSLPRTGGTSLGKWLASELNSVYNNGHGPSCSGIDRQIKHKNFQYIHEPINLRHSSQPDFESHMWDTVSTTDNVVIKYVLNEFGWKASNIEPILNDYDIIIKHYRQNLYEEARSWVYQEFSRDDDDEKLFYHEPYTLLNDWEEQRQDDIKDYEKELEIHLQELLKIESDLTTTYEQIYEQQDIDDISKFFGFDPQYLDIINPKNRLYRGTEIIDLKKKQTLI